MPRQQFLNVPGTSSERRERIRKAIDDFDRQFAMMPEEDQILYLLAVCIAPVRELSKDKESMLANARRFISDTHGPKFADRVLGDPEMLKKLHLDTFTPPPEGMTTVVR